ncbi:hypothetical protein MSAN_00938300 [Mycena sanguinolenta]|uniref:Uncharacterized protein n=1 Tax=Mycena sanguinolenta TaxID=230812 RepID=A0A8H6YZU7_9AGAR|nr:hypothetical protein MSAN_00938300 [Mycena sanguinolenta]
MGIVTVNVSVNSQDLVYFYDRKTLIATYSSTFAVLVLMTVIGMFCFKNGKPSSNSFSRFLLASRNPELDVIADAVVKNRGFEADEMHQVYGADLHLERGNPVFGLAGRRLSGDPEKKAE